MQKITIILTMGVLALFTMPVVTLFTESSPEKINCKYCNSFAYPLQRVVGGDTMPARIRVALPDGKTIEYQKYYCEKCDKFTVLRLEK